MGCRCCLDADCVQDLLFSALQHAYAGIICLDSALAGSTDFCSNLSTVLLHGGDHSLSKLEDVVWRETSGARQGWRIDCILHGLCSADIFLKSQAETGGLCLHFHYLHVFEDACCLTVSQEQHQRCETAWSAVDSMAWHSNSLRIGLEATSLMGRVGTSAIDSRVYLLQSTQEQGLLVLHLQEY